MTHYADFINTGFWLLFIAILYVIYVFKPNRKKHKPNTKEGNHE